MLASEGEGEENEQKKKKKKMLFNLYNSSDEHVRETFFTLNNIDNNSTVDPRGGKQTRFEVPLRACSKEIHDIVTRCQAGEDSVPEKEFLLFGLGLAVFPSKNANALIRIEVQRSSGYFCCSVVLRNGFWNHCIAWLGTGLCTAVRD